MHKASATEIKNRFGEFLEKARTAPVSIEKTGREVAVMLSREEYDRLLAIEDAYWGRRAERALKKGDFLGPKESDRLLRRLVREKQAAG
jgi:prevent-host-death family protein